MSNEAGYLVVRIERTVYVRALGMANMVNAPTLDAFLQTEMDSDLDLAVIDLSECTGMDSTFMGTLVGSHHRMVSAGSRLLIVNPSKGNRRLLDMLGVSEVVPVLSEHTVPDLEYYRLSSGKPMAAVDRALYMKKAHEDLIALSEANKDKFTPFLAALEADLKRHHNQ